MNALPKLTTAPAGVDTPLVWPAVYRREPATQPRRLAVAASTHACALLADLAQCLGERFFLLYVHVVPRGPERPGRYQSPLLQLADVRLVLDEFAPMFEQDGRHHLWIHAEDGSGTLVYDRHDIVYAYGPLPVFEQRLQRRGFAPGDFTLAVPHGHHYHARFDAAVRALLQRWDWHRTELRPEDE